MARPRVGVARRPGSLAARLAFSLRSRILADLLPAGTVLPPERLLAEALAVSRSTLTHGAQHAIDLALATLCEPGDAVAVEDPTYAGVLDVIAARRLRAVPLAADARGPTPAALEEAAARDHDRLFLLPAVHNRS